jgi:hypothetical protein
LAHKENQKNQGEVWSGYWFVHMCVNTNGDKRIVRIRGRQEKDALRTYPREWTFIPRTFQGHTPKVL